VSLCLATAALAVGLAVDAFTLSWTHSVERTEWRERWRVDEVADVLVLTEARVRGSGAGMEPPDGAVLRDGWWVYRADRRLATLRLAVSGATGSGWRLCTDGGGCRDLERWLAVGGRPPASITVSARSPCRPTRLLN
jgi:hypothetical protein